MRFLWLVIVAVGLIGVVLYLVAYYDYSNFVDERGPINQQGLQGWVRYYQEHNSELLFAPLVAIFIGIVGYWRRPRIALRIPAVLRRNSASIAIMLTVINFGLLTWQIWPEGSYTPPDTRFSYSAPSGDFREVTEQRVRQLERELSGVQSELSDVRGFGFERRSIGDLSHEIQSLRNCINSLRSGRDYLFFGC